MLMHPKLFNIQISLVNYLFLPYILNALLKFFMECEGGLSFEKSNKRGWKICDFNDSPYSNHNTYCLYVH